MEDKSFEISVVLRTKNSQNSIADTLESIKNRAEIIVIDEHSNDDTIEIAKEYKAKIIYAIENDINLAYNQAFDEAKGDWIFLVEDDEIVPEKLFLKLSKFIENPVKNRFCLALSKKTFYLNEEVKSQREKEILRFFKKGCFEFDCGKIRVLKGKVYKLNKNFKNQNEYIIKFIRGDILKLFNQKKADLPKKPSLIIKPIITFIYQFFIKGGIFDGKRGYIFSSLEACNEFKNQILIYEKEREIL